MRLKDDVERLWIDSICIDQEAVEEKSHQVELMGEIYKSAASVVIWLGPHDDDVVNAMKLVADGESFKMYKIFQIAELLGPLLCKDYWFRVWITQEVVLARRLSIRCGSCYLSLEKLLDEARDKILSPGGSKQIELLGHPVWILSSQRQVLVLSREAQPEPFEAPISSHHLSLFEVLGDMIYVYRTSNCKVTHDRVYAFLGLYKELSSDKCDLQPDYSSSLLELSIKVLQLDVLSSQGKELLAYSFEARSTGYLQIRDILKLTKKIPEFQTLHLKAKKPQVLVHDYVKCERFWCVETSFSGTNQDLSENQWEVLNSRFEGAPVFDSVSAITVQQNVSVSPPLKIPTPHIDLYNWILEVDPSFSAGPPTVKIVLGNAKNETRATGVRAETTDTNAATMAWKTYFTLQNKLYEYEAIVLIKFKDRVPQHEDIILFLPYWHLPYLYREVMKWKPHLCSQPRESVAFVIREKHTDRLRSTWEPICMALVRLVASKTRERRPEDPPCKENEWNTTRLITDCAAVALIFAPLREVVQTLTKDLEIRRGTV